MGVATSLPRAQSSPAVVHREASGAAGNSSLGVAELVDTPALYTRYPCNKIRGLIESWKNLVRRGTGMGVTGQHSISCCHRT